MTSEAYQYLRSTFEELLAKPEQERTPVVHRLFEKDPALASGLQRMLAAYSRISSILDASPGTPASSESYLPGTDASEKTSYQVGPYIIGRELGRGIAGTVYEAVRADSPERVAIKILHRDLTGRRFERELQRLVRLQHPNISRILDGGLSEIGEPYFVMEYVDGRPITRYCSSHALSVQQKLQLFLQICEAVQYGHRNLLIHGDLKPQNILVTQGGDVKLLDFGISRLIESGSDVVEEAISISHILISDYASPEQIREEYVSTSADVFALGIVLYELITDEHPFRRSPRMPPHDVRRAICTEEARAPSAVAQHTMENIEEELDAIILKALCREPEQRYASVERFAEDVQRYRQGRPIVAMTNGDFYRLRKFAGRHWLLIILAFLLISLLASGGLVTWHQAYSTKEAPQISERSRAPQPQQAPIRNHAPAEQARRGALQPQGGEIGVQRDLAAAYEHVGDLQAQFHERGAQKLIAAMDAYKYAVEVRTMILERPESVAADRRDLALSIAKLGDAQLSGGETKEAIASYQAGRDVLEKLRQSDPKDITNERAFGEIDRRRCAVLVSSAHPEDAIDACREGSEALSLVRAERPDDLEVQRTIASTEASYADALRLIGRAEDSAIRAKMALDTLHRLEALAPSNGEDLRLTCSAEAILASSLADTGDISGSIEALQGAVRSIDTALKSDSADLRSLLRPTRTVFTLAQRLSNRDIARDGLQLLQRIAERTSAGPMEWNEYANALVRARWADLRQPDTALALAERAVRSTGARNPRYLNTLAWAYFRKGDTARAVETANTALDLLPAEERPALRNEIDHALKAFLGDDQH